MRMARNTPTPMRRPLHAGAAIAAAVSAAIGLAPAAMSQTIDGAALSGETSLAATPPPVVAAPERRAPRVVDAEITAADASAESEAPDIRPISPLRSATGERVLRLTGEEAEAEFSVHVPEGVESDQLRLLLRSSVTVLPEQSELRVWVNGEATPPTAFTWFNTFANVTLDTAGFRPGANTVRLALRHRHRIYCGVEASFSLWTEVAAVGGGAVWPSDMLVDGDVAFKAALQAQLARGEAIELRIGDDAPEELVKRIGMAISAHAGAGETVAVRRASLWSPAEGSNLARISLIKADVSAVDVMRGGDGAMVLRIAAPFEQALDLDALFAAVERVLPAAPTPLSRPTAEAGRDVALSELGFASSTHEAHVFRRDFDIATPEDWLVLDDRDALLTLRTREWPQANNGAVVTLLVNEAPAGSFRVDGDQRQVDVERELRFPANLLRPGPNRLSLRGELPNIQADRACPPLDEPSLEVLDASTIWLPPSASFAEPGLAEALGDLSGDAVFRAPMAAELPEEALFALATIGGPTTPGTTSAQTNLAVLSAKDLSVLDLGDLPASRGDLRRVVSTPSGSNAEPLAPGELAAEPQTDIGAAMGSYVASGLEMMGAALDAASGRDRPLPEWLSDQEASAVLLQPRLDEPSDLWLVLADDANVSLVASAIARGRAQADGPQGQVAVLTRDGDWASWRSPAAQPQLLTPIDSENALLAAGAYGSWAPGVFALIGLGASWICALLAAAVLRRTRPGAMK